MANKKRTGYVKGRHIKSLTEFSERLEKRLPFYWRHKFMAAGFIENWSIIMIKNSIKAGVLICAEKYQILRTGKKRRNET